MVRCIQRTYTDMAKVDFYCYRCRQHKRLDLLSEQRSESGKPMCITCEGNHRKGQSLSRAHKHLNKQCQDFLIATLKDV